MTTERDNRTRIVLSWLREDAHENAERVLLRALDEVDATPQRRSWWPARRFNHMNAYAKLIAGAAALVVVAVVGYQFLPGGGGSGTQPTITPSPTLAPLARGSFTVPNDHATVLDATGAFGAGETRTDVTGTMTMIDDRGDRITVDLDCARRTEGGLLVIAGTVADSTADSFPKGSLFGIILQRGSPVRAGFMFGPTLDGPCLTFAAGAVEGASGLRPIEGTVELAP